MGVPEAAPDFRIALPMADRACLNVIRHPVIPVPREQVTYEQFCRPEQNDDRHPTPALPQLDAAVTRLLLDPGRPLVIRPSPLRRTTRPATILAERLAGTIAVFLLEEPALAGSSLLWSRVYRRETYVLPENTHPVRAVRLLQIIVEAEAGLGGGKAVVVAQAEARRKVLVTSGTINHVWVSHGLLMPFMSFGLVDGPPPETWTLARLHALGRYDDARGFAVRLPLP